MSAKLRIVGACFLGAAVVLALSPAALAQRGGRGSGGGRGGGGGGKSNGGNWTGGNSSGGSGGSALGLQHNFNQSPTVHSWGGSGGLQGIQRTFSQSHDTHSLPFNPGHGANNFVRGEDWNRDWGRHGDWDRDHDWWHDHGHSWNGWWGGPWGPSFGVNIGWWPGYYDYYSAPYYYGDAYVDYGYQPAQYTTAYAATEEAAPPPTANGDSMDFYPHALEAFQRGDYRNAARLASHASIDDPRNPDVHTLLMLGLFAIGEYRGAAMEAHAVTSLGQPPDWAKLYGFYGSVTPFTEQLRALEKFVAKNPTAPEGRFLLGFQYMMEGHRDAAKGEFLQAVKLAPKDKLAAQLLTKVGGTVPVDIASPPAQPPAPAAK